MYLFAFFHIVSEHCVEYWRARCNRTESGRHGLRTQIAHLYFLTCEQRFVDFEFFSADGERDVGEVRAAE